MAVGCREAHLQLRSGDEDLTKTRSETGTSTGPSIWCSSINELIRGSEGGREEDKEKEGAGCLSVAG